MPPSEQKITEYRGQPSHGPGPGNPRDRLGVRLQAC